MKLASSTNSVIISFQANTEWKWRINTKLTFCRAIFRCVYWQLSLLKGSIYIPDPLALRVFFLHIPYLAYKLPENFLKFIFCLVLLPLPSCLSVCIVFILPRLSHAWTPVANAFRVLKYTIRIDLKLIADLNDKIILREEKKKNCHRQRTVVKFQFTPTVCAAIAMATSVFDYCKYGALS